MISTNKDMSNTSIVGIDATADNVCTSNTIDDATTGHDNGCPGGGTQRNRRRDRERGGKGYGRMSTNRKGRVRK